MKISIQDTVSQNIYLIMFLQGGCGFVAALLQYFFLSSFCWMLCEGIMLYLMLVVVFSTLSKRWYVFLAIGWGKKKSVK